jgi:uncharacterized protein (TIGR03545 family)
MIRWRYILTRVVIVVLIIVALRYTLAPIANYVTVGSIESTTDYKASVVKSHVGLFPPTVTYEGMQLTLKENPKEKISAESVELEIDGEALLHRRYVVLDGRISGLKIGTPLAASNSQSSQPSPSVTGDSPWLTPIIQSMTNGSADKVSSFGTDLEMVKLADQIRRRWKSEYAVLTKRAADLEAAVEQIQAIPVGLENPLRDRPRVEATLEKTKTLQEELAVVRTEIDEIPTKIQSDLISLQNARQKDIDRIDTVISLEHSNAEHIGSRLLADTVNEQVDRIRQYLSTGRQLASATIRVPEEQAKRGENIDLIGGYKSPSFLVQRCEVKGELQTGTAPYELSGVIENLATDSSNSRMLVQTAPFRARLKLEGPQVIRIDYSRDDSSTVVRESLAMHWPEVLAPAIQLGDRDSVSLDVHDGRMEVWAEVNMVGNDLQGRLVSRRLGSKIDLQSSPSMANSVVVSNLKNTLSDVDRLEFDATFVGTWTDLNVDISTNLAQVMKTGMERAVAAQAMVTRAELTAKLDATYQTQVAELQSFMAAEQSQARNLVAKADKTIQSYSEKVVNESTSPEFYLGRLRSGEFK